MDNIFLLGAAIIVLIIVIILRKDITKLVDWIVSFRKITKHKKRISLEGFAEPEKTNKSESKIMKQIIDTTEKEKTEEEKNGKEYFSLYIDKKYDQSLQVIEKSISETEDEIELIQLKSIKALVLFSINRENAIQLFEELIKQYPNDFIPFEWYALSYYWNNIYDKCLEVIEKGLKTVEDKSRLITVKSNCFEIMGDNEKAIETLLLSIQEKNDVPFHYQKLCELLKDDPKSAYKWFQIGLQNYPDYNELRKAFASFLEEHEKKEESLFHYSILTNNKPESPEYLALLGNSYLANGLNDKALEAYKKANNLAEEKENWIIANIGNIYKNQGFYTEAINFLKKSIEIRADSEYSHDRLAVSLKLKNEEDKTEKEILTRARKKNKFETNE